MVKRKGNLISSLCNISNILLADSNARKAKKRSKASMQLVNLNVSRATFDNYVREGKLPRGKHEIGFKELSWNRKTLDEFIRRNKHEK